MATYNKTGTAGNDAWSFANVGGQPSNNNVYNLNGAAGTDSFRFDDGLTSTKYIGRFLSTNFTIGAAVGGVITVTGASTGGTNLTFNLTSVETLIFGDKTVTLTYSQPNLYPPVFTSGATGTVAENSAVSTVIYTAIATDADGTTPTYSLSGTDASLLNINATNGQVTLITSANYETKTSYSFNVIASDGDVTHNATKAVVVSVTNLNDNAPVFTSGSTGTVVENAVASTVIYTATATDADNLGSLVYSLSGTDASLLNIDAATGAVTLKSPADYETKTSYSFNVVASDGANNTAKAVVVSVTNVNDNAPVFSSGSTGTVVENAATSTVIYTAVATDADNLGALVYSLSGIDASLLNINASTGAVTLKTSADYETKTSYSFNVIASDGSNNTTKAVVVSVTNVNDNAPVFTSGSTGTVVENAVASTAIYTAAATDADNLGALVYSLSGTDASMLNIDAATGAVTLKSPADYETKTSYSFNAVVSDGTNTVTKAVVVSVTNVNDNAPVFSSGSTGTVAENAATSTVIYTAMATDADNLSALTYSLSGIDASLLNIDAASGAVTLKNSANYETKTSYSFNVVASDGTNNTTKAVVVSVTNLNDNAPVFTSGGTGTVAENAATSTVIYTGVASDADNLGALAYSLSGTDASLLNINASTGAVTLKSSADYELKTSYSFNVIASDGTYTDTKAVVVSVTNVNDNSPVFTSGGSGLVVTQSPAGTLVYTAVATDADNLLSLVYSLSGTDASLLNINATTGAVTLKSVADYATKPSYSFNVVASDGTNTTSKAVLVSVQTVNNYAPVFTSGGTGTVTENAATSTVIYTAVATDADGNTLTYSLSGTDASLLNIDAATGAVTLKSSANYEAKTSYSFNVVASDGVSAHDVTKAVVVSVTNVNDNAPVFTSGSTGTVIEGAATSTVIYTAAATDADNLGALTYSLSGTDASLLNIDASTGAVKLNTSANYETKTSYSFNVIASDGSNNATEPVVVSVTNVNDNAPVFTSGGTGSVAENAATSTVIYTAVATDADNLGALIYSLSGTDALLLNINSTSGVVTLKSSANYEAKTSYSFNVVASDGDPTHDVSKAVVVSVTNVNDNSPVFTSGSTGTVIEGAATSTVIYTATATDADNLGALTYSLNGADASLLNIDSATGVVTLKSSANYETKSSYSFNVIAGDGDPSHNVTQAVVVSVTNVNDNAPVFTSGGTGTVAENAATSTVIYTATATDADNLGALTYSLSGTDASLLNIDATTGVVTLKTSANYETKTSYSFNVVASDGDPAHDATKAVVVSVTNLNDNAPVFTSGGTGTVAENAATSTVIYTAAATDADNLGALTYSLSGTDASLLNIDATTGVVTLKTSANYEAKTSYSFNVIAGDGDPSHNVTQAVVVSVTNLNDNSPVFTSGGTGAVVENAATSTVIYTATATDADNLGVLTYSLSGTDASLLNIDAATGVVKLNTSADYETKTSYSFNVVASDSTNSTSKAVVVSVTNLNDNAPVFTSGGTSTVINSSPSGTVIYNAAANDADNLAALTYSLSGTDASLLNINASTGAVSLKSPADNTTKPSYSFNVAASDGTFVTNKAIVVTVQTVNNYAPVFTSGGTGTVAENAATSTVIYTAVATDQDFNSVTYALSGTDASLLNIDAATGAVTLKSSANYEAKTSYTFNVVASDGLPAHDVTKAVVVSVTNLNDNAPVFTSGGTGTVAENAATSTVIYTATATDADNLGALTYALSGTDASLLNIDASTGAVTLKTSANYEAKTSYSFNVVASDGDPAHNATKAVVVSVTDVNDNAPVFTSGGTGTVAENAATSTVIYTATATDADNLGALTYSLSGTDASLLNIDASTGAVTLKTSANYEAKTSYSFNVVASDGDPAHNATKAVVVSVTDVNDNAPVFTSGGTGTVAENAATSTVIYTATATDADNLGALTYSLSGTDASLLNIDAATGAVTLKTSANYEAKTSYSFNVVASDGDPAHNASKAVVVSVTNVNDNAPVFTSGGTGTVAENAATSTVIYTATATDADNLGALTYSLSGTDASLLNIDASTGAVTLKTSANYEAKTSYSFNVVASDGDLAHNATKAIVVSVTNVNDNAPVFTSGGTGTVVENAATSAVIYTAIATDADGNNVTYSLAGTDASLLNIDAATGAVTLKTSADYETKTSYNFNVVASDGDPAHNATTAVVVNVTNLNDNAPVFTSGSTGTVAENAATSTVIYTAVATDADSTALTYSLSGTDASLLNIDASTGAVTLKTSADYETKTSYSFNVVVSDGTNNTTKAVVVSVTNQNDNAPVFTSGSTGTVAENAATSTVIYTAVASDADGNSLTYSLSGTDASLLNINATTGAVTLKTSADYETKTNYSFNVVASDGTHNTSKAVLVGVTNVNEPPVSSNDSVATHDTVTRLLGIDDFGVYSDPENSPVSSIKIVSLPSASIGELQLFNGSSWNPVANGQVIISADIAAGNVRFDPVVGMTSASIGFLVSDGTFYSSALSPYTLTVYAEQVQTVSSGTLQTIGTTGITVTVPTGLTLFSDSLPTNILDLHDRIAAFADQLVTDTTGHENVHTEIDTFISGLADPSSVNVREFEMQADASFNTSNHIIIDGSVTTSEALVIDASHLPSGTVIDLNNVEFAVIIGPAHLGGGLGNNIIVGDGASQYIVLGAGEDLLDGGAGDDTIGSRAGNDTLIGGDGNDTALFNGDFNHYSISYDEATDTYTVVDTIGTDGTDTVTGFEHFQFADGTRLPQDSIDMTKPTVQTFTPLNSATGVGIAENIVLKFSEAVHLETGLIQIHSDSASGTVFESFEAASSTRLTISGDTLTIDPTGNLVNGTSYYVTFADGSIQDYAGNHFTQSGDYHFSTVAAAVAATGGSSSGGGGGAVIAGVAALGLIAWLAL